MVLGNNPASVGYWLSELRKITNYSKLVSSLGKGNIIISARKGGFEDYVIGLCEHFTQYLTQSSQ